MSQLRQSEHGVHTQFLERWSSRAYESKAVPEDALLRVLEAATWAPSANNLQPWSFVVAKTEEQREKFYSFILEGNLAWCKQAPVLILLAANTESAVASFDSGTAWGYLALQAKHEGLITRAMGGFEREKAKEVLNLPAHLEPQVVIALGYQGDKSTLPQHLQERDHPTTRKALQSFIIEA